MLVSSLKTIFDYFLKMILDLLSLELNKKTWPTEYIENSPRGVPALLIKSTFAEEGAIPLLNYALRSLLDSPLEYGCYYYCYNVPKNIMIH
jgi:hypothetical protein